MFEQKKDVWGIFSRLSPSPHVEKRKFRGKKHCKKAKGSLIWYYVFQSTPIQGLLKISRILSFDIFIQMILDDIPLSSTAI